mmetsp:Transcript_18363/g.51853  ORF Transcript_18363/g.51853 Transcript_18363/m.51853 type:complete len:139 (+) Transcript_18363:390-806(+)
MLLQQQLESMLGAGAAAPAAPSVNEAFAAQAEVAATAAAMAASQGAAPAPQMDAAQFGLGADAGLGSLLALYSMGLLGPGAVPGAMQAPTGLLGPGAVPGTMTAPAGGLDLTALQQMGLLGSSGLGTQLQPHYPGMFG